MSTHISRRSFLIGGLLNTLVVYRSYGSVTHTLFLGETSVVLRQTSWPGANLTCIALHENESTATKAAKIVLAERGGTLVELCHSGSREVEFRVENQIYLIDPNRIFTDQGIRAHLRGPYSPLVHKVVKHFAATILRQLSTSLIVSLHNNTEERYSVYSYTKGAHKHAASRVAEVVGSDLDDFFFVTDETVFSRLRKNKYNVVLQTSKPEDDGSLSVYCAQNNISYVNIEAQHGHLSEQCDMIHALYNVLSPLGDTA